MKIYCPKCRWEPRDWDIWVCQPSCGHEWNTFDTGGVCPSCSHVWDQTQCPMCGQWSPHLDWYHDDVSTMGIEAQRKIEKPGT